MLVQGRKNVIWHSVSYLIEFFELKRKRSRLIYPLSLDVDRKNKIWRKELIIFLMHTRECQGSMQIEKIETVMED